MNRLLVKRAILPLSFLLVIVAFLVVPLLLFTGTQVSAQSDEPGGEVPSTVVPYTPNNKPETSNCHQNCSPPPAPTAVAEITQPEGFIAVKSLNVREGPGLSYKVIDVVYKGDEVTFTRTDLTAEMPYWIPIMYQKSGENHLRYGFVASYNPDFPSERYVIFP